MLHVKFVASQRPLHIDFKIANLQKGIVSIWLQLGIVENYKLIDEALGDLLIDNRDVGLCTLLLCIPIQVHEYTGFSELLLFLMLCTLPILTFKTLVIPLCPYPL